MVNSLALPIVLSLVQPVQATSVQDQEPFVLEDVVVRGRRGAALVSPETELDGAEIDALGAENIGEVIERTASDYALGEAPLIIVNGRRMPDPAVFSRFPPDALVRVEVLPTEAAGLYGARDPARRVVNIVLQHSFSSVEGRARARRPTAGGSHSANLEIQQSSIIGTRTRQLGVQGGVETSLRAGERDRDRTRRADDADVTLRPATESLSVNWAETATLGEWAASARASARRSESRSSLLRDGDTLDSRRRFEGLTLNAGLSGDLAGWSTRLAVNANLSSSDQSGVFLSDSRQQTIAGDLGLSRPLYDLPAGSVIGNLSGQTSHFRSVTKTIGQDEVFSGHSSSVSGGVTIPLTRASDGNQISGLLGNMIVSVGADLNAATSGLGSGMNAALTWAPRPKLDLAGSWSRSTQAVADDQRLEPAFIGNPIRVFDFVSGAAVEVLPVLGGNPDLRSPRSERLSISASVGPFTSWEFRGGLGLQRTEATDGIGSLPDPTPQIENAFPDRFQRDPSGQLVSIDRRPINLAAVLTEGLSSKLAFRVPFEGAGVVRVALNHTWQTRNTTTIRSDLPEVDRLVGDAGGSPRRAFSLAVDFTRGQWRMNAQVRMQDGYRVRRDIGQDGLQDLQIGPLSSADLRLGYQFQRNLATQGSGARRGVGLEIELEVANLLDRRPTARLGDGSDAPGYARNDQDPLGRTVAISIKRRF